MGETGALVDENRLIKQWRPPGNVKLKRTDGYVYIRARLDIPYPVLEVAPIAKRPGVETFILDDGWQAISGDWHRDSPEYPEPRWDGTHLLSAWHPVQDGAQFWPWYEPTREAFLRCEPPDPEQTHAETIELLQSTSGYGPAARAALRAKKFEGRRAYPADAATPTRADLEWTGSTNWRGRCSPAAPHHGHSIVELDDRHAQQALRAELRRLARHWRMRVRTVAQGDRVAVARVDEQPWDDDERAAIQRVNETLRRTADQQKAGPPPDDTTPDGE